jgi:hypothetical protein
VGTLRREIDPVLSELDKLLFGRGGKIEMLSPMIANLLQQLDEAPALPQAWQPLGDEFLDIKFPSDVVSAWLFALRGNGKFPGERHPNSWQRSIALRGRALFEVYSDGSWQQHQLDGAGRIAQERTISIPHGMWHRIAIGPDPFVSLSFHMAPAAELIEETCENDDFSRIHSRLYQG